MEQEIVECKKFCGSLYLKIVKGQGNCDDQYNYDGAKDRLMEMITELAIVDQMIADGHE